MSKKKIQAEPTRACPECGGAMRHETRRDSLDYKGQTREVETTGWWCSSCDEAVLEGDGLMAREAAFLELRAQVDDVLSPAEVVEIRRRLGISQRRAGEVLGGGPRAFQKYEKGTAAVSAPMSNLLRLLSKDPTRLKELEHRDIGAATPPPARAPKTRNIGPAKGTHRSRTRVRASQ